MSEDRYLNYGKLITDSHTGEELITCKSNKNAEQITSLLNMQQARIKELEKENDDLRFALRTEQAFTRVEKDKKPFLSKEEFLKELEDE